MMNTNKKNTSICVVLLGIIGLSIALKAEAEVGMISPFCTEGNVTPQMKAFCSKTVIGAKTWEEAATTSVHRVMRKTKKLMKPILESLEEKLMPSMPISKKYQIINTCKNSYQQATQGLKACPSLITVGPFSSYGSTLTSTYSSIEECRDAIVEEKGQPDIADVTRFTNSVQKLIDVALIISKKDPRVAAYNANVDNLVFKDSAGDPNLIGPLPQNYNL